MTNIITNSGLDAIIETSGPATRVWLSCVKLADPLTLQLRPFDHDIAAISGLGKKAVSNALTALCHGDKPRLIRIRRGTYALNPDLIYPEPADKGDL